MLKAIYFSAIALLFLSSGSVSATTSSETVLGEVISVMAVSYTHLTLPTKA